MAYFKRGYAYHSIGDTQQAISDYSEAIRLDKEFAQPYYNRGNAYMSLGKYVHAIQGYDEAIRLESPIYGSLRQPGHSILCSRNLPESHS